ncbi:MAG TPA: nuclear transport factor 2 family protein [Thermoanaerobaculia bacterium]|jgi:ketosteroid isomerase-like protein
MTRCIVAVLLLLTAACASVPRETPEDVARAFVAAIERSDADAMLPLFADDATAFFPVNDIPFRADGKPEIEKTFRRLFSNSGGHVVRLPIENLRVQGRTVTFEIRNPNVTSRRTLVLEPRGGRWLIVHFHGSNIRVGA